MLIGCYYLEELVVAYVVRVDKIAAISSEEHSSYL